jgi:hypothetical protein
LKGFIAWSFSKVALVRLDLVGQVHHFASFQWAGAVESYGIPMMVDAFIMTCQADLADQLPALGLISRRDFIFWEDRIERAFWNTRAAVDASVWIDIKQGPFFLGFPGYNAFHRADIHATAIAKT